ncbi:MAG: hypothetical protein ABSA42_22555 [Terracidiphilus sp.]|jgi:hypothetical protein
MGMVVCSYGSVVINQINVEGVLIFEAEENAPVSVHRNGPEAFQFAFQPVQPIAGKIHRLCCLYVVEPGEDIFDSIQQIWPYSAEIAELIKPLEAAVLEVLNHWNKS